MAAELEVIGVFQAVWALGNIAGDNAECRDYVLNCGILPSLQQYVCVHTWLYQSVGPCRFNKEK